ncbi:Rqc2 family fibronectin-binding protein [Gloeothece verrucosa]|uniref:Rqc2 homolog RqcH n=1 Tax=Gloeothece verrucosa (strain PCC 7822) TaxID=497965 RepID=E0UE26_GLOV7|nr:NFACT RNA binding domain-containing protein [Gloeothece verrucosa]ADN13030.1 Fibronectin-binding A domain protein [Gloeothece verrucosa PCC 7822]
MQSVDYTTLAAISTDLQTHWLPARVEQVYQRDRHTIALALRTLKTRGWLTISWHPVAARICMSEPPPRTPDTFTFSDQLRHQLNGYALIALNAIAPWERVIDFQFAKRPGEPAVWHLYVEIMGKYSNVILTDASNEIVTVAHQVNAQQSSVRTVQTGQPYELPPTLTGTKPSLDETFLRWRERVSLVPGKLQRQLLESYRGLSPTVARAMIKMSALDPQQSTDTLTDADWKNLFDYWQEWLKVLQTGNFTPGWSADGGYTVLGWDMIEPVKTVQILLDRYYSDQVNQEKFSQLRHQLTQKINNLFGKLRVKADGFSQRLQQSEEADRYRQQADLLMANLHQWKAGMTSITLNDFETGQPVNISLNPEKNAVQNAQSLYKQHQKLKRARSAVEPLLKDVVSEINYLEQVEASLNQIEGYTNPEDLKALEEIREELIAQNYIQDAQQRSAESSDESLPYRYPTPSGFEVWIGRNNRQNDKLTFRVATDYDLWFHTQEIAGSHVLLRLEPGSVPDEADLQTAANWAAYYSRARQSEQVAVVYTEPKYVYKPKGALPGMVVYKRERILWGYPHNITG